MVDEIETPTAAPAASTDSPSVEAVPSTTPETPISTPAESAPVVAPVDAPVDAPVEPSKPETPPEPAPEVAKPETLLAGDKKPEEKPTEKAPEVKEGEKPAEVKAEEPASLPTYEPFKLPENVEFDATKMGEFTNTLAAFENTTKASHEEVQKLGQQLVDRHIEELNRYTQSLTNMWNKQKNDWKDSFLKDPEFLNRTDTVVNSAIDAISVYGGDAKQQAEFRDLMEKTGVGNHPAMIRMLSNVMLAKAEPKPLAAPQIATAPKGSKIERMYGKKTG